MGKVYNTNLCNISEQISSFGLEGQPIYQVALSRQSFDMGQVIICDMNHTYKKIQNLLSDEIDVIDLTQYKKAFVLPGCPVSATRLKESLREHKITITSDWEAADFYVTHGEYGQYHSDGENIKLNSMLFKIVNYEAMDIDLSVRLHNEHEKISPKYNIIYDTKMMETHGRINVDYDIDLYEGYVFTPLALQIAHRIRTESTPVIYAETCLNESANKIVLDESLMNDIIRMMQSNNDEDTEMIKKMIPSIDYRKKKHLLWKMSLETSSYTYKLNRDKDVQYWMKKSGFNDYYYKNAEQMIKRLEREECLDTEAFRYLEPIVRKEISINNRELYTFKVQVKEEYRKFLKIKK